MDRIFLKPVDGLKIPMPENAKTYLPENGKSVKHDQYWARRIIDGDVIKVKQEEPVFEKNKKNKKKED